MQIAMVKIQTIGANSIKTPIDNGDIPEGEGTTTDGRKTSCRLVQYKMSLKRQSVSNTR
jgi:hypothetical protein